MRGVLIIGAGPAGLMAAETCGQAGLAVTVIDANPRPGRKFLLAGRSGLNLTHSQPLPGFALKYGLESARFARYLHVFGSPEMRAWADGLGAETFVGSSGRVFPKMFKGANLLAAWCDRLTSLRVRIKGRWALTAIERGPAGEPVIICTTPTGEERLSPKAVILALGGASWPDTGSTGTWATILQGLGVDVTPFRPSNVAVTVAWPQALLDLAGTPLKTISLRSEHGDWINGEAVISSTGLEGGGIYTVSQGVRDDLEHGPTQVHIDLKPGLQLDTMRERLKGVPQREAAKRLRLSPVVIALLDAYTGSDWLASIKDLTIPVTGTRPISEAISTAGGVAFEACDDGLQLKQLPGAWVCGEMLNWEAPTGGYLLQGCATTGVWAARSVLKHCGMVPTIPDLHSPQPQPGISR